jgi:hypothetical protein
MNIHTPFGAGEAYKNKLNKLVTGAAIENCKLSNIIQH